MRNITKIGSAALLIVFGLAVSPGHGEMMEKEKGMMGKEAMMGEHKMALMADSAGKGAKGEAMIKDSGAGQKEITLHMTGLKPNSVYTVWLVNMKPKMDMIGIGEGNYAFKSDPQGEGHYSATVSSDELKKWQMLEIAYHPDGDPKNMKNHGTALKAGLMMEEGGMMEKDGMMEEKKGMMEKDKGMMKK